MTGVRKIRGGALLARALKEKGIEHVFTFPEGFAIRRWKGSWNVR